MSRTKESLARVFRYSFIFIAFKKLPRVMPPQKKWVWLAQETVQCGKWFKSNNFQKFIILTRNSRCSVDANRSQGGRRCVAAAGVVAILSTCVCVVNSQQPRCNNIVYTCVEDSSWIIRAWSGCTEDCLKTRTWNDLSTLVLNTCVYICISAHKWDQGASLVVYRKQTESSPFSYY